VTSHFTGARTAETQSASENNLETSITALYHHPQATQFSSGGSYKSSSGPEVSIGKQGIFVIMKFVLLVTLALVI
jgi:hypothetical protein